MPHYWTPDTCPGNPPCRMEIIDGHKGFVQVVRLCAHHIALRAGVASDEALFTAALNTNRNKNKAAAAVEAALGTTNTPWRIQSDDMIVLTVGGNNTRKNTARTAAENAVGTGKVIIE
jgi:hypothetical protein